MYRFGGKEFEHIAAPLALARKAKAYRGHVRTGGTLSRFATLVEKLFDSLLSLLVLWRGA